MLSALENIFRVKAKVGKEGISRTVHVQFFKIHIYVIINFQINPC